MVEPKHIVATIAGMALLIAGRTAEAQLSCPQVPADAFAFISDESCRSEPDVRWPDGSLVFDCGFLADGDKTVDCGGDPGTCVELCRTGANVWNADLPGRFTFREATPSEAVAYCDPEDGRISIGGSTEVCDGSALGDDVLAITSLFFDVETGEILDADVVVNQAFGFTPNEFQSTLTHELGHVLGLDHPDECGNDANVLMRSSDLLDSGDPCYVKEPTIADINGAMRIYDLRGPTGLCGDADMNSAVNVSDGVQILRAAAELPSVCVPARCDVDGNGAISVTDGVNVLRAAAELPFAGNCPP